MTRALSRPINRGRLTPERVWNALTRRLADLPHPAAWHWGRGAAKRNQARLARYVAIHRNERCIILANGPSLLKTDLRLVTNEITFGMNRIYLAFDQLPFVPTYYLCLNELVLEQYAAEIALLAIPKFLNWDRRRLFSRDDDAVFFLRVGLGLRERFSPDLRSPLGGGGTVTYAALQLAYGMGFQEVVLVGLDHSYSEGGTPNVTRVRTAARDEDHFVTDYFPAGTRWQLPDLRRSEGAYRLAREAFELRGGRIIDATPGGKCEVFEKAEWTALF